MIRRPLLLPLALACPARPARPARPAGAAGSAGQDGVPPALPAAGVPAPERVAWFAKFQDARSGPESTETITRTFKVGPNGSLDIFNLAGPIVVTRHAAATRSC